MKPKIRVAVITNIIPKYREGFFDRIFKNENFKIDVYCQKFIPGMNIKTIHEKYPLHVKTVRFLSAEGEKIAWQFLPWIRLIRNYDVIVVQGNPRYISDLVFGTFLRLINKRVVLWTMAHSYRSNSFTEKLRLRWTKIFDYIFVYTDKEVNYLQERGFQNKYLVGMNNGLDQKLIEDVKQKWSNEKLLIWKEEKRITARILLVSCARVVKKNKFNVFIDALSDITKFKPEVLWCLIGDGDEMNNLKATVVEKQLGNNVLFVGEMYDQNELAPWFLNATLFIHPAAIGLGLLQAYGFGVPVITHDNEMVHGPEFGAFSNGETGFSFKDGNSKELAETVVAALNSTEKLQLIKLKVLNIVKNHYNVDIMAERFLLIITATLKPNYIK
jgi:glycosyltransferase involved in cell wall biosynthesis